MSPGWMTERPKLVVKINDLPDEILLEIFSYLPLDDMMRSALVCERWHYLLKGEKELWRGKVWTSGIIALTQRFLPFGAIIPRLRSLRLLFDSRYEIHVAWPDVTVYLYLNTPNRWEPYFHSFNTESLVVSSNVVNRIASYIQCTDTRTLRRICVVEQSLTFHWPRIGVYPALVSTSPHSSCSVRGPPPLSQLSHSAEQCYSRDDPVPGGESGSRRECLLAECEAEGAAAPEGAAYVCPALEVVNVHCRCFSAEGLGELCALGPVRVLRIEFRWLSDLLALRGLGSHLEELYVAHCANMKLEGYRELRGLVGLRALRLDECRLEEAELQDLTAGMPHLRTLSLNGRELLARSH